LTAAYRRRPERREALSVASVDGITSALKTHAPGTPLVLLVHRSGEGLFVAVD
jgi:hypothetical protein